MKSVANNDATILDPIRLITYSLLFAAADKQLRRRHGRTLNTGSAWPTRPALPPASTSRLDRQTRKSPSRDVPEGRLRGSDNPVLCKLRAYHRNVTVPYSGCQLALKDLAWFGSTVIRN